MDDLDPRPGAGQEGLVAPPGFVARGSDLSALSDHDLLAGVLADQWLMNRLEAARQAKVAEFHARRRADHQARRAEEPHFTMTPLRETAVEVAALTGATEGRVKSDLRTTRALQESFPGIWALVEAGQLDLFRASRVTDAASTHLSDPVAVARFAAEMTAWFDRHLAAKDRVGAGSDDTEGVPPLVTRTARQIGNHVAYLVKKLRPQDAEEQFRRKFTRRSVSVASDGDGMAQLVLSHDVVSLRAVDYRLTLLAKALRRDGDPRNLEQLRTDLAVDLLLGRLTVDATTGELAHPDTAPGGDPTAGVQRWSAQRWARPVINVTVPIQTLLGVSDHPGVLSGGESIPAGLVRAIAADPSSTWYRLLTDPSRSCVELSTTSYKPTEPIVRQVVADYGTCLAPACTVPASVCELDHRVPAPAGPTSTGNLGPVCKAHHQAKHAPGYGLRHAPSGDLVFTTAAGFTHPVEKPDQPTVDDWGPAGIFDEAVTLAQLRDALAFLAHERERVESSAAWVRELDQAWADYRASYPDATDDQISAWIHDDDPSAPPAPPILRRGRTLDQVLAGEQPPPFDTWGVDADTLEELQGIG